MQAEQFILTTDYATLKNDDFGTISVSLPAQILNANQVVSTSQDIQLGTISANTRLRIASSKDGNLYYSCKILSLARTGQTAGPTNVPYNVYGYSGRISPDTIRVTALVKNPYAEGMAMEFGTETFTFEISTFLSPFVS